MRRASIAISLLVAVIASAQGLNSLDDSIAVEVLGLFHPTDVKIVFDHPVVAKTDKSDIKSDSFDVALDERGMTVNGKAATHFEIDVENEFTVIVPERFSRKYRGSFEITPAKSGELSVVVRVPPEEYVAAVAFSEIGEEPNQARIALSVAVRSWMMAGSRHRAEGFDFCDTTHCALFKGLDNPDELDATRKMLASAGASRILYDGKVVPGFFHAACGGYTHSPEEVWGRREHYPFPRVKCGFCSGAPNYRWHTAIKLEDLSKVVGSTDRVELLDGGANRVIVRSKDGETPMTKEDFRIMIGRRMGWSLLPSPWFVTQNAGSEYRFRGIGYGHGVGMCVAGAVELAKRGMPWEKIVAFYFPKTALARED